LRFFSGQLAAGSKAAGDLGGVSLNELEKQAIIETLAKTGNNREKAAKNTEKMLRNVKVSAQWIVDYR